MTVGQLVEVADRAGFPHLEVPITWMQDLVAREGSDTAREMFGALSVRPAQFTCGLGVPSNLSVSPRLFAERLAGLPNASAVARSIGCTRASFFVDPRRHQGVRLEFSELCRRLVAVSDVLAAAGITPSVEFIGLNELGRAAATWEVLGGRFGILIDSISLAKAELGPEWIVHLPSSSVSWLRLADAPAGRDAGSLGFHDRLLPGTGVLPLRATIDAALDRGYNGPVSVEVGDPRLAPMTITDRARAAYEAIEAVLA